MDSKVLLLLIVSWTKAWSQEDFTLVLSGLGNGQNILCVASSVSAVNGISLTINGDTNIAQFGYFEGPPANATTLQFFNPSLPSGNNSLVALCHSGNVTSNSFSITVENRDFIPITFAGLSSQQILNDPFTINCTSNTIEVIPNGIVLRINGVINPARAWVIGQLAVFTLNATLALDQTVAQCTFEVLGSIAGTIFIRERVCEDCEYFCASTSTCLSRSTFCSSRDDCSIVMVNCAEVTSERVCEVCGDSCAAGEYYCPASSRCLPESTLCDRATRCDTCVSEKRTCEVCDSTCSSGEYFCASALECLSESTLCDNRTCPSPCGNTQERTCRVCGNSCPNGTYYCQSNSRCLANSTLCDITNCREPCLSNEKICEECTSEKEFYCLARRTLVQYDSLCSCAVPCLKNFNTTERCNCNGRTDFVNCDLDNTMCISSESFCDGRRGCSNGFDEDACYAIRQFGFPLWAIILICVVGGIIIIVITASGILVIRIRMRRNRLFAQEEIDKEQCSTEQDKPEEARF